MIIITGYKLGVSETLGTNMWTVGIPLLKVSWYDDTLIGKKRDEPNSH